MNQNYQKISESESNSVEFDLFSDSPSKLQKSKKLKISHHSTTNNTIENQFDLNILNHKHDNLNGFGEISKTHNVELVDSFDDSEGYYLFKPNDILKTRYRVISFSGKGVFSTVLRVIDLNSPSSENYSSASKLTTSNEFVIKIIRNNEVMLTAGKRELKFCLKLAENDPPNKKHTLRLFDYFYHKNHLCLVFEAAKFDCRQLLKKYGSIGISLNAIQIYSKQLLIALKHLEKNRIIHADLKPDNILVFNNEESQIKLGDFGSAYSYDENIEMTPYLVSRFYRAPEIILGISNNNNENNNYLQKIDIWSLGTTLYELYTGKVLFSGKNNNEMLYKISELKGEFSLKMLKRGIESCKHFNLETGEFLFKKFDPLTKNELYQSIKLSPNGKISLFSLLKKHSDLTTNRIELTKLKKFSDFLSQILTIDPNKRPTIERLIEHPFIKQS